MRTNGTGHPPFTIDTAALASCKVWPDRGGERVARALMDVFVDQEEEFTRTPTSVEALWNGTLHTGTIVVGGVVPRATHRQVGIDLPDGFICLDPAPTDGSLLDVRWEGAPFAEAVDLYRQAKTDTVRAAIAAVLVDLVDAALLRR